MDHTASQDIYKCFDAVWPYLVEKIGIAVDGDPEKIRELQRSPYNSLQLQLDSPSASSHVTGSFLPSTAREIETPAIRAKREGKR